MLLLASLLIAGASALPARAQGASAPVSASLYDVLHAPPWTEGSFRLYRWDRFPSILVLDTADYAYQERMLSRLAFFLEKKGFRGSLLTNAELAGMHGWNAHDYGGQGLASFFEAARRRAFPLNPEELVLRDIAVAQGILVTSRGGYRPGQGGIISISRSSSPVERRFLLSHESFHGIFFASPEYRSVSFGLWDSLSTQERSYFSFFLDRLGYDVADPYLCVNELQAYLVQQPARYAPEYFARALKAFPETRESPPALDPQRLESLAGALSAFLTARFAVEAGGTVTQRGELR